MPTYDYEYTVLWPRSMAMKRRKASVNQIGRQKRETLLYNLIIFPILSAVMEFPELLWGKFLTKINNLKKY